MCQTTAHRHSIFCILPPHILHSIILHGTSQQRAHALQTLSVDHSIRTMRVTQTLLPAGALRVPPGVPPLLGATPQVQRTIYNTRNSMNLPGNVVRTEGADATDDPTVDEA